MLRSNTTQHSAASPPLEIKNPLEFEEIKLVRFKGDTDEYDGIIASIRSAIPELPPTNYYAELASRIQKSLGKEPGGVWNCIVGAHFSFSTKLLSDLFCQIKVGPYVNIIVYCVKKKTLDLMEESEKDLF